MTLRISAVAGLAAAGLILAACQTTGSDPTTRLSSEEGQACVELGYTPGTEVFAECVEYIGDAVDLFRTQLENEYGGHIDVDVECEVDVHADRTYTINCTRSYG